MVSVLSGTGVDQMGLDISHLQTTALREDKKKCPQPICNIKKHFFSIDGNCRACEVCLSPIEITFDYTSIFEFSCVSHLMSERVQRILLFKRVLNYCHYVWRFSSGSTVTVFGQTLRSCSAE